MRILLVRHPAPAADREICYGRLDVPVDPAEAFACARSVRQRLPSPDDGAVEFWSSPAQRCLALARLLAGDEALRCSDDLWEMDFGAWEGRRWCDIPREQLDAWSSDLWDYRVGGGESARAVEERWLGWLATRKALHVHTVVAVTHAGIIRVARSLLDLSVAFGSVHELQC